MPDRQFGRIRSPFDSRDWKLGDFIPDRFSIQQEAKWDFPCTSLDQEYTNHCVGFGMAHFGINLPVFTQYTKQDAHNFYYKCKEIDGDPQGENGTYIRSAAKVLQDVGAISHYAFAQNIAQIRWWLLNKGPLIVGTIWTENMMVPDENGVLDVAGLILGGHAYLINEWRADRYLGIKNSWGPGWGTNGKAFISVDDFEKIFTYGGEALAAVELENYHAAKKSECWLAELFMDLLNWIRG